MKDRKRVKITKGMDQIILDLKPRRNEADVFANMIFDVTNLMEYLAEKKKNGENITFFHAFVTAIGKIMYKRERLNYFIANRHLYEHTTVSVSFVAKQQFNDESEEIMLIIPIEKNDNINSISKKIKDKVDGVRVKKEEKTGANSAIDTIGKLPNVLRIPVVGAFKFMDKHGWLPADLVEGNLYYSSIILSNLGTLHFDSIYHNNTNFGTASSIATIGEIKEIDGKKIVEVGINFDERVADGFYLIKSLKMLQEILNDPKALENDILDK